MWNRIGMAFGLGAVAAGGFLWVARSLDTTPVSAPVVIVQAPPPPPAAYVPSSAVFSPPRQTPAAAPAPPSPIVATRPTAPQPKSAPAPATAPAASAQASAPAPVTSAPSQETRAVSASSMPALPPPNLPSPTVGVVPNPLPPSYEDNEPLKVAPTNVSRGPRSVTIPAGTMITVRLRDTVTTSNDSKDDPVVMTLDAPLIVNGLAIAERGSLQKGRIVELDRAGRMGSRAKLALVLTQLTLSDGQTIDVQTDSFVHQGEKAERKDTLRRTATWAAIAASIGAMAGGGKGAAIGAGAGAAAGAGSVIFTKSPEAVLPSESRLTFRMTQPVTVTEKPPSPPGR